MSDKKVLPPELAPFVMQWGELGSAWGIGRSAARIHGLLLVSEKALAADEIVAGLDIARMTRLRLRPVWPPIEKRGSLTQPLLR